MYSSLVRVQNVFSFLTSVVFAVAAAMAVSVLLSSQTPTAELTLKNVRVVKGRPHYYSTKREEYAHITFDLDTDLSSLFNWNTKQVFLYITASYPSQSPDSIPASEAIIWDAIIPSTAAPYHPNTYVAAKEKKSKKTSKKSSSKKSATKTPADKSVPGILRLDSQRPKYQITDSTGKLAERGDATLTLHWNIQPWVGALTWTNYRSYGRWAGLVGGKSESFDFPAVAGTGAGATASAGKSAGGVRKEDLQTEKGSEARRGKPH